MMQPRTLVIALGLMVAAGAIFAGLGDGQSAEVPVTSPVGNAPLMPAPPAPEVSRPAARGEVAMEESGPVPVEQAQPEIPPDLEHIDDEPDVPEPIFALRRDGAPAAPQLTETPSSPSISQQSDVMAQQPVTGTQALPADPVERAAAVLQRILPGARMRQPLPGELESLGIGMGQSQTGP